MNSLEEQANFVQEALRAGKQVAVAVPRQDLFERVVRDMIPADLEIAARPNRLRFKFANGATLTFVPSALGIREVRGRQFDAALYYPSIFGEAIDRERTEECYNMLREHGVEMRELELP